MEAHWQDQDFCCLSGKNLFARCGMSNAKEFLARAGKLALKGMKRGHGGPFGAVIVKEGRIIGEGWNRTFKECNPSSHAEVVAIRDACKRTGSLELAGCTIYSSGEPCPMCMSAIYWAKMDACYFSKTKEESLHAGFDDRSIYQELALPWNARALSMAHLPVDEATEAFEYWMRKMKQA